LYWRFDFFINLFDVFSLEIGEFEPIIGEWVETVFNGQYKVISTYQFQPFGTSEVEKVSNLKVKSYGFINDGLFFGLQPVLDCDVREIKF
jgi:hypothetical protein